MAVGCHQAIQPCSCHYSLGTAISNGLLPLRQRLAPQTAQGALFISEKRDQQSCLCRLGSWGDQKGQQISPICPRFFKGPTSENFKMAKIPHSVSSISVYRFVSSYWPPRGIHEKVPNEAGDTAKCHLIQIEMISSNSPGHFIRILLINSKKKHLTAANQSNFFLFKLSDKKVNKKKGGLWNLRVEGI